MNIDGLSRVAIETFNISEYEFKKRRTQAAFMARMCVMKYLHNAGYNYSHIGGLLNKDRVTVMYALEQYENLYSVDRQFRKLATQFKQRVRDL